MGKSQIFDRLSDENKMLEKNLSKAHCINIAQPVHIANIADFNEAIRKFASSFLLPKTDVSFYRMMLTYLGSAFTHKYNCNKFGRFNR